MKNLLLLLTFLVAYNAYAQKGFDTANVILCAKMELLDFSFGNINKEEILYFMEIDMKYRVLKSEGFEVGTLHPNQFVFFELIPFSDSSLLGVLGKPRVERKDSVTLTSRRVIIDYRIGTYIFAYDKNGGGIYKLKGFKENDFWGFYNTVTFNAFGDGKGKRFCLTHRVEGLDLCCLYKSMKADIKMWEQRWKMMNKYKCLQPLPLLYDGVSY